MMEVLVVIVILAILLALVTNVVKRLLVQAGIERTKATMALVLKATERYYDEKKVWPPDLASLSSLDSCKELLSNTPDMVSAAVINDGFGRGIVYSPSGGPGGRPRLTSYGPDQIPGTKDDITVP
jgi:type II secretory pathway pseudopilin PulG